MASYTKEHESVVTKVLACKPDQYYQILQCEKSSSDSEIKKSYRKLAVKLHPDKNSHPRASEAFKYLNKAWGVLSDPSKKRIFDQTGADPDSRFAGHGGGGSSSAAASGFSRGGFETASFDDDIFRMFFGGNAPGSAFSFGGNNGFTFQWFGGDGFDPFSNMFAQQQRQRQRQQQQQRQRAPRSGTGQDSTWDVLKQLAPILFIFLATIVSSIFSREGPPNYSFVPTSQFSLKRETPTYKIPFYVNDKFGGDKSASKLRREDRKVEQTYIDERKSQCSREKFRQKELIEDAHGWFFTDQEQLDRARNMPMPSCQELWGYGILY